MKQQFNNSLNKRKWVGIALLLILVLGILIGCSPEETNTENVEPTEILVYVSDFDNEKGIITFDQVEWLSLEDTERITELGLNIDTDFPSGFYVYNEVEKEESLELSDNVEAELVNWDDLSNALITDQEGLAERLEQYDGLYHLTIEKDVILKVVEKYTP
ncbi:hypothetical protein Amet_1490 [Alkaliphilus metalliredigens QYMF]|uniref:Lipoprotein n=1 Tax=Alkaliphilus metalliredigens (strain QYMF) TaxID=293826 RepID=A6TNB8_ALKMQ|nr:hypothetical protein [Alkaliphilus metalliredigens]ABR47686.1 hypothetical protein Amet_1490 [Alkaliphilus metalliredigens QYMF]